MERRTSNDSSHNYRNKGYRPNYIHNYHKLKTKEPEIVNKEQRVKDYVDKSLVSSILKDIKQSYTNKKIQIPELENNKPIFREIKNPIRPQIKNTLGCTSCGRR